MAQVGSIRSHMRENYLVETVIMLENSLEGIYEFKEEFPCHKANLWNLGLKLVEKRTRTC